MNERILRAFICSVLTEPLVGNMGAPILKPTSWLELGNQLLEELEKNCVRKEKIKKLKLAIKVKRLEERIEKLENK